MEGIGGGQRTTPMFHGVISMCRSGCICGVVFADKLT